MKNKNLNIIKLNIITTILTLTFISCDVNKIDPQLKNHTDSKENAKILNNKSQDQKSQDQKSQDQKSQDQKPQDQESQDQKPRGLEPRDSIILKLKQFGKTLEAQKKQEDIQIAKMANTEHDFLSTLKIDNYKPVEEEELKMKRMIYSAVNYDIQKITVLKEIIEKLNKNPKNLGLMFGFLTTLTWRIQSLLESRLESIKNDLHTLDRDQSSTLLMLTEYESRLKQRFAKTLNETIEDYNQNKENIKNSEESLANYMNKYFKDTTTLKLL
ncbi:complement regulator-acquiring protein (plasmid) [Borreliella sinica]|uniref:complement regulator-acquiring protein n=1 Tax=Borreliella sinica TaxID=87162 RepID=UPI002A23A432|nr:complement regulator-acquiring protein [Borreliella sinica]WPM06423.1 complement regulator-acquiring protein [Borreliella sinica]